MSQVGDPAAVTGVVVAGLTNPDFLIEVEAIAFVPGR
jgi:enamine deaminase RidA (YjgF/YER057c/UK114 family)